MRRKNDGETKITEGFNFDISEEEAVIEQEKEEQQMDEAMKPSVRAAAASKKKAKTVNISVYVTEEQKQRYEDIAAREDRSLANLLRNAMEEYAKKHALV